ncbi:hypothetical protein VNO78_20365 [Psophocarpus tetragonolobus]|uniref:Uncharacterized protein n=1 Tax=Psophocarpus tetragonolobus TaxID=3891 RepID=A0AAN9XH50_PSOTE
MLRLVVSYLIEEYSSGRTSNPNVLCNTRIKFGAFLDAIGDMGFHYVASRHYANVIDSCDDRMDEPSFLELSLDMVKDQTYFLSHLSQSQLKRFLAPLGCIPKEEVYRLARKFDLPNKDRKNSQGICFLGKIPDNLLPGLQLLEGQMSANQHCLIILLGETGLLWWMNLRLSGITFMVEHICWLCPFGYPTKAGMQASGLVISASPGGPAFRTSVSSRDVILAIDDTSTENMGLYDAAKTTGPRRKLYSFDHS